MKRRLKLTPFAKIVFAALIIVISWYIYKHQDDIKKIKIVNFNDTLNVSDNSTDTLKIFVKDDYDTLTFCIKKSDSLLNFSVENNDIIIPLKSSKNDTLIFLISAEKKIKGRIIIK